MIGMIPHDMPLRNHSLDKLRVLFDIVSHQKERRVYAVLFQRVEDRSRAAVFIAGIKGQIDFFLRRIAKIDRAVFPEPVVGSIADRRLSLRLKAQSPRAGRQRRLLLRAGNGNERGQHTQHDQHRKVPPQKVPHCKSPRSSLCSFSPVMPRAAIFPPAGEKSRKGRHFPFRLFARAGYCGLQSQRHRLRD